MMEQNPELSPPGAPLDAVKLQAVIDAGETMHVEFKGDQRRPNKTRKLSDDEIAAAAVCLANKGDGIPGWLLVGVEKDRKLSAIRTWGQGKSSRQIQTLIKNRTVPGVTTEVHEVPIDGRSVTVVKVFPASSPTRTKRGRYLKRTIGGDGTPACVAMDPAEIDSLKAATSSFEFSAQVVAGVKLSDLSKLEFERFRQRISDKPEWADQSLLKESDENICRALKAVDYESGNARVRMLGLLLFGTMDLIEEYAPTHEVVYQVASNRGIQWNEVGHWPLLRVMDELENLLVQTAREDEIVFGVQRIGLPELHPVAIREAVANALVHRDYFQLGKIQVRWLGGHFDISSPGSFPAGVDPDTYLVNGSKQRNPLIISAFRRCGVVEEFGRGIRTIFERQLLVGRPCPVFHAKSTDHVILRINRGKADLRMVRLVRHEKLQSAEDLLDILLILDEVLRREGINLDRAKAITQQDQGTVLGILTNLEERTILHRPDQESERWTLSDRARGICDRPLPLESATNGDETTGSPDSSDEPTHTARVLAYTAMHGRITRGEVMELCQLESKKATRLLKRLADAGVLLSHGRSRRDTWYGLPALKPDTRP